VIQQNVEALKKVLLGAALVAMAPAAMAQDESREEVLERIRPIGTVVVSGQSKEAAAVGEPEVKAAPEEAAPSEPADETASAEAPEVAAADAGPDGQAVYQRACFACHGTGVAGAPKLGDQGAWDPRIAKGMDTLVSHAINGFQGDKGMMPPKGGNMSLSDDEVAAAVSYMVEESQ
jgi:cytochrome c5